jgi:hypothetical protein
MKRSSAVRHLVELADEAARLAALPAEEFDVPLRELWVGGDLVTAVSDIEHVVVILMLDVPAAELPEIALHEVERGIAWMLRLHNRPAICRSRPVSRPPWSHLERRVARFWSADGGPETATIDGLRRADLAGVHVVEPGPAELASWLREQIAVSEAHLREVLDRYWEGSWRRRHSGDGIHPDDHLWRAAWAVQSMRDALAELGE